MRKSAGLMTEFKTEAGRPIYISDDGEIVSEKSVTINMGNKFVNVPSIHDGIQYSEDELAEMIQNKEIKPTSTHKTEKLAVKAAEKRSPSLMSEDTARAVEDKYKEEIIKKRSTFEAEEKAAELITPEGKARKQMDILLEIEEDPFNDMIPGDKDKKIQFYLDSLSDQEKELIKKVLEMPKTKIKSVDADDYAANLQKKRVGDMNEKMLSFAEGGLKDEGGTVDPVSGNKVPSGSTQKEVRDDIPAQLSEGEFVFPADVVRYIGLENLMELRQKAKVGLARMENMGQMGNSEEAIIDDSGEYNDEIDQLIDNFDPNDPEVMRFAEGGVVYAQQGALVPGMPQQQFSYGFMPPQQQRTQAPIYPQAPDYTQFVSRPAQLATTSEPAQVEDRQYIGPNGELITIRFMDGKAQQQIPAGFKVYKPEEVQPEIVAPTVVTQPDTGGGDGDDREREQEEADRLAFDAYETNAMIELSKSLGLGTEVADAFALDPRSKLGPNATLLDHVKALAKVGGPVGAVATNINLASKKSDFYDTLSKNLNITRKEAKELIKLEAIPQYVDKVTTGERNSVNIDIGGNTYGVTRGGGVVGGRTTLTPSEAARRANIESRRITASGDIGARRSTETEGARIDSGEGGMGPAGSGPSDSPSGRGSASGAGTTRGESRDDLSGTGRSEDTFSSPFSEGGAVQEQTKRALKSSRKKK
jgi:hypothetical protein